MIVKRATAEEAPIVERMCNEFVTEFNLTDGAENDPQDIRNVVAEMIGDENKDALLGYENGEPVGMVCIMISPLWFCHTKIIAQELAWYVEPQHRQNGSGKKLLRAAEKWGRERGAKWLCMAALGRSAPAKVGRMYLKAGFKLNETTYVKELK